MRKGVFLVHPLIYPLPPFCQNWVMVDSPTARAGARPRPGWREAPWADEAQAPEREEAPGRRNGDAGASPSPPPSSPAAKLNEPAGKGYYRGQTIKKA